MRNLVLIGMMGCGKTTVGKLLAQKLGFPFVDTDAYIESKLGRSIPELFAREGEGYFRAQEREAAEELARRENLVIACGGGLPTQEAAIAPLKASGMVFWLRRDAGQIYDSGILGDRPLAQAGRAAFVERAAQREPIYHRWADYFISNSNTPEEAEALISTIYQEVCQP